MIINVAVHALVLPFVDLTLLACNACTAIIVNMILSTRLLGEKFIWQYDVTAMVLIAIGSISIVLNANTEQVNFTPDEVRDLLLTPRTMIYTGLCFGSFVAENFMLSRFYSKLREFEQDALAYEED